MQGVNMQEERKSKKIINLSFENFVPNHDDGILFDYNQEIYAKIIDGFKYSNKVLFEQATGTGKTYIVLKFLKDFGVNKRVLFVAPAIVIKDYFEQTFKKVLGEHFNICLETCLYQSLKNKIPEKFDIIVFDEAHRLGAKTWGPVATDLMANNPKALVLGMSATLGRTDGVEVKRLFNDNEPVSRLDLVEALRRGILPKIDYVLAKINFKEDNVYIDSTLADLANKLRTATGVDRQKLVGFIKELKKAKKQIAKCEDVPSIVEGSLSEEEYNKGKFIVFCPAGDEERDDVVISRMQSIMDQIPIWFRGRKVNIYNIYSGYTKATNRKTIKAFEEDNSDAVKLLCTIDMLNEGFRVKDVNKVFMVRPTSSVRIYLQQLGRAMSARSSGDIKIIDFVANLTYLDAKFIRDLEEEINEEEGDEEDKKIEPTSSPKFKLHTRNVELMELIHNLKTKIFEFNNRNAFDFKDFYSRLVRYKERKGDLNFKYGEIDEDGYPLYVKRKCIKKGDIRLSDSERQMLVDLGLDITTTDRSFDFESFLFKLTKYKEEHGHLKLKSHEKDDDGYPLYDKVQSIKRGMIVLKEEDKQKLVDLGLDLSSKKQAYNFDDFYNRLVDYVKRNNHLNIKWKERDVDDYPLGQKITNIKCGQIKLTEEQRQKLTDLGLILSTRQIKANFVYKFDDFYARIISYKERVGNLNIKYNVLDVDGYPIGEKLARIKTGNIKLKQDEIEKLTDLGVNLNIRKANFPFIFEDFVNRLKDYKQRNSHLYIGGGEKDLDGYPLGEKKYDIERNNIKLTSEQKQILQDLGLKLVDRKSV